MVTFRSRRSPAAHIPTNGAKFVGGRLVIDEAGAAIVRAYAAAHPALGISEVPEVTRPIEPPVLARPHRSRRSTPAPDTTPDPEPEAPAPVVPDQAPIDDATSPADPVEDAEA